MGNQSKVNTQVKDYQNNKKLFHNRIRIAWFSYKYRQLLSFIKKRMYFDVIVDHLALTHIITSYAEPTTAKIMKLLEPISSYSSIYII